jgi:hypothetical protein
MSFLVASFTTSATSPFVTVPNKTPSSPTCFLTVNLPIVVRAVWKSIASCFLAASFSACFALLCSTCFKTVGVTGTAFFFWVIRSFLQNLEQPQQGHHHYQDFLCLHSELLELSWPWIKN